MPLLRVPYALLGATFLALAWLPASSAAMDEWTVLAYMSGDDAGDNPMEGVQIDALLASRDIVRSGSGVNFVAQLDRSPKRLGRLRAKYHDGDYAGATRWRVLDGKVTQQEKLGEVNMGDPATLYDFLRWGVETFPAKRYAVVLSGHGSGILSWRGPGSVKDSRPGRVNFDPFTAYDDTDDDTLTVFELREVFRAFRDNLHGGRKLDLLAFESCLPGALEAVYEVRDSVGLFVASPDLTYYGTFPYTYAVGTLARAPGTSPAALAEAICKGFIDLSGNNGAGDAMMAWRTDRIEQVASDLSRLALELLRAQAEGAKLSFQQQNGYWGDGKYYWDLELLGRACARGTTGVRTASNYPTIQKLGQELAESVKAARLAGWYDGQLAERKVGGLSVFWPNKSETYRQYRDYYQAFELSQTARWADFLDKTR